MYVWLPHAEITLCNSSMLLGDFFVTDFFFLSVFYTELLKVSFFLKHSLQCEIHINRNVLSHKCMPLHWCWYHKVHSALNLTMHCWLCSFPGDQWENVLIIHAQIWIRLNFVSFLAFVVFFCPIYVCVSPSIQEYYWNREVWVLLNVWYYMTMTAFQAQTTLNVPF